MYVYMCELYVVHLPFTIPRKLTQVTAAVKNLMHLLHLIKTSNVRDNITMVQLVECWRGVGPVCRDLKIALTKTTVDACKAPKELGGQQNLMKIVSHAATHTRSATSCRTVRARSHPQCTRFSIT